MKFNKKTQTIHWPYFVDWVCFDHMILLNINKNNCTKIRYLLSYLWAFPWAAQYFKISFLSTFYSAGPLSRFHFQDLGDLWDSELDGLILGILLHIPQKNPQRSNIFKYLHTQTFSDWSGNFLSASDLVLYVNVSIITLRNKTW